MSNDRTLTPFDPQLIIRSASISRELDEKQAVAIASALRVAFFASLFANEGRQLEFVLAVVADPRSLCHATLSHPETLSPETMKRLSAALDPDERCFVVAQDGEELKIHGIAARPCKGPGYKTAVSSPKLTAMSSAMLTTPRSAKLTTASSAKLTT